MEIKYYGPKQFTSLVKNEFASIASYFDRAEAPVVLCGPFEVTMDGEVRYDQKKLKPLNESFRILKRLEESVLCRSLGINVPAIGKKKIIKASGGVIDFCKQYSSGNIAGFYTPVFDVVVLGMLPFFYEYARKTAVMAQTGLSSDQSKILDQLRPTLIHEMVHWDHSDNEYYRAVRRLKINRLLGTLNAKSYQQVKENQGNSRQATFPQECLKKMKQSDDSKMLGIAEAVEEVLAFDASYDPNLYCILTEALAYAVQDRISGDGEPEYEVYFADENHQAMLKKAWFLLRQEVEDAKNIKGTIARVKEETEKSFRAKKSPLEFLLS